MLAHIQAVQGLGARLQLRQADLTLSAAEHEALAARELPFPKQRVAVLALAVHAAQLVDRHGLAYSSSNAEAVVRIRPPRAPVACEMEGGR